MMLVGKNTFTYFTTCMYKDRCKHKLHLQQNTWSTNGETVKPYRATNFEPCNTFEHHSTPTMHKNQLRNALSICWRSNFQGYLSLSTQKRLQSNCQGDQDNSKHIRRSKLLFAKTLEWTSASQRVNQKHSMAIPEFPMGIQWFIWDWCHITCSILFLFASPLIPIDTTLREQGHLWTRIQCESLQWLRRQSNDRLELYGVGSAIASFQLTLRDPDDCLSAHSKFMHVSMQRGDWTNGTLKITKVQRKLTGEELHAAQACSCGFHYPTLSNGLQHATAWFATFPQLRVHSHHGNDRHSPEQNEYLETAQATSSKGASLKPPPTWKLR